VKFLSYNTHKNHLKIISKHSFIILYYTYPMDYKTLVGKINEVTGVTTIPEYGSKAFADLVATLDESHPELSTALMDLTQRAGARGYTHPDAEQERGAQRRAWLSRLRRKVVTDETSEEGGPSSAKVLRLLALFFALVMLSALGYGMYQSNQLRRVQLERLRQADEAEKQEVATEASKQIVQTSSGATVETQAQAPSQTQNPYDSTDTPESSSTSVTTTEPEPPQVLSVPLNFDETAPPPPLQLQAQQPLTLSATETQQMTLPPLEVPGTVALAPLDASSETTNVSPLAESSSQPPKVAEANVETGIVNASLEEVAAQPPLSLEEPLQSATAQTSLETETLTNEPTQAVQPNDVPPATLNATQQTETPEAEAENFRNALSETVLEPGQKISARLSTGITVVEGVSSPVLAESLLQDCLVVGLCPTLLFRGSAELISGNKVRVSFDAVIVNGEEQSFQGIALDAYDNNAISVAVVDEAPTVAQDLIRNALGGLSDYVEALSQAKTVRVLPSGETIEESSVPGLETFLGAAAAKTFQMPATSSSFVRVAQLPAGTPLKVLTGVSF
jgi:hypothetical protein